MHPSQLGCTTATFGGKLPEKLEAMQMAGFTSTELWPRDVFENAEGPDVAIDVLRRSGLAVSVYQALRNYEGMPANLRAHKLGIAEQLMDQMALIGCKLLVLCSNTDPESSGERQRIADDLRALGDLARSRDIRIAYEALSWGRWMSDYRDAWQVIEAADHQHVGMMLDSFHVFALGLPLDGIDAMAADKVFLVEIADLPATSLAPIEVSRALPLVSRRGRGARRRVPTTCARHWISGLPVGRGFQCALLRVGPERRRHEGNAGNHASIGPPPRCALIHDPTPGAGKLPCAS